MKTDSQNNHDEQWPPKITTGQLLITTAVLPGGNGGFTPCPELMTEDEIFQFLRIPEISHSKDYHNVIEHLKRYRSLPRIHICNKALYPKKAILDWLEKETLR